MKNNTLISLLIFISMVLIYVTHVRIDSLNNTNKSLVKENAKLRIELDSLKSKFKKHINKCAFISLDDIQKISSNGRVITLYFPTAIHKRKFEIVKK